jgi:hypothetical protein
MQAGALIVFPTLREAALARAYHRTAAILTER